MHLVISIDGEELIARDCQHAHLRVDEGGKDHVVELVDAGDAVNVRIHHGPSGDHQGITLPHHHEARR